MDSSNSDNGFFMSAAKSFPLYSYANATDALSINMWPLFHPFFFSHQFDSSHHSLNFHSSNVPLRWLFAIDVQCWCVVCFWTSDGNICRLGQLPLKPDFRHIYSGHLNRSIVLCVVFDDAICLIYFYTLSIMVVHHEKVMA